LFYQCSIDFSQTPIVIHGTPDWKQGVNGEGNVLFYDDKSGDNVPFDVIQKQAFRPFSQKVPDHIQQSPVSTIITWLTFRISNTLLPKSQKRYSK
jgi:hypothetical protein